MSIWNGERLTFLIAILLAFICFVLASPAATGFRKPFALDPYVTRCSRNMACKWAVCVWSQDQEFADSSCNYFDNHCTCDADEECSITEFSEPTDVFVTWEFRCQPRGNGLQKKSHASKYFPFSKSRFNKMI